MEDMGGHGFGWFLVRLSVSGPLLFMGLSMAVDPANAVKLLRAAAEVIAEFEERLLRAYRSKQRISVPGRGSCLSGCGGTDVCFGNHTFPDFRGLPGRITSLTILKFPSVTPISGERCLKSVLSIAVGLPRWRLNWRAGRDCRCGIRSSRSMRGGCITNRPLFAA